MEIKTYRGYPIFLTLFLFAASQIFIQATAQESAATLIPSQENLVEPVANADFNETGPPESAMFLPVPNPNLEDLEPAVKEQIEQLSTILLEVLGQAGANSGEQSEAFGLMGQLYHAYELFDAARSCYLNAGRLAPNDFRWLYLLASVERQSGEIDRALELYKRACRLEPGSGACWVYLGRMRLLQDLLPEAAQAFEKALKLDPENAPALAGLGQIALSRHRYERAARLLHDALEIVPAANLLHYPLAMAYRGAGELKKARKQIALRGTVGVRPSDPLLDGLRDLLRGEKVHLVSGKIAFQAGRIHEAAQQYQWALAANPNSVPARVNLGSAMASLGETDGAMDLFRGALKLDPENGTAHYNLARLLGSRGDEEEAMAHFQAALGVDPKDLQARLDFSRLLARTGRLDEAVEQYRTVSKLSPTLEDAPLGEAGILIRQTRFQKAIETLESASKRMPSQGRIAHALARLLAAVPRLDLRDGPRALDLARRVYRARQTLPHAQTLVLALAEAGRCAEATALQREVILSMERSKNAPGKLEKLEGELQRYKNGPPCRPPAD